MILKFACQNFYSINKGFELNFNCNGIEDDILYNGYFNYKEFKLLNLIGLFGSLGTNKKDIFNSVKILQLSVLSPLNESDILFKNYYFHKNDKPSSFMIEFIHNDIRYKYTLKINDNNTVNFEELYYAPNGRSSLLFKRDKDELFIHPRLFSSKEKSKIIDNLDPYKTIVFICGNQQIKYIKNVYDYFKNEMLFVSDFKLDGEQFIYNLLKDDNYKSFIISLLKSFEIEVEDIKLSEYDNHVLIGYKAFNDIVYIEFNKQSDDASNFIFLASNIYLAIKDGKFLICDEIDNIDNTTFKTLLKLILDDKINIHHSQLMFITSSSKILSEPFLKRDAIYLIESDKLFKDCNIYCLSQSFSVRKYENIENGYLSGRYIKPREIDLNNLIIHSNKKHE